MDTEKSAIPAPPPAEAAHPDVPAIIAFIVAVARNGVIGRDNALPWLLPGDFRFFKAMTLGKPVVMGRRTFESIGRPLPRRPNIVVSSTMNAGQGGAAAENLEFAAGPAEAIERAGRYLRPDQREIMVIGGAGLFDRLMGEAHRLYLTDVDAEPSGDTYFAAADHPGWGSGWRESWSFAPDPDPRDSFGYRFRVLDRAQ